MAWQGLGKALGGLGAGMGGLGGKAAGGGAGRDVALAAIQASLAKGTEAMTKALDAEAPEGVAGGGLVRVRLDGHMSKCTRVTLDPELLAQVLARSSSPASSRALLEDTIRAAVTEALVRGREVAERAQAESVRIAMTGAMDAIRKSGDDGSGGGKMS